MFSLTSTIDHIPSNVQFIQHPIWLILMHELFVFCLTFWPFYCKMALVAFFWHVRIVVSEKNACCT